MLNGFVHPSVRGLSARAYGVREDITPYARRDINGLDIDSTDEGRYH